MLHVQSEQTPNASSRRLPSTPRLRRNETAWRAPNIERKIAFQAISDGGLPACRRSRDKQDACRPSQARHVESVRWRTRCLTSAAERHPTRNAHWQTKFVGEAVSLPGYLNGKAKPYPTKESDGP